METPFLKRLPTISFFDQQLTNTLVVITFLIILSGSYLVLAGSTVRLKTIQYDEFTDLVIADRLSQRPLSGHSFDGSQARFPMYISAVAQRIAQLANPDIELLDMLTTSRWISILMTILAIWGTYILGSRLFNPPVGLVAAILFTFSPFVLEFGRDALTQGDAFTTPAVVFSLITFWRFNKKRTTFWLVAFSFCLALAIAAKFFLVVLIPALITFQVFAAIIMSRQHPIGPEALNEKEEMTAVDWPFTFLAVGTGLFTLIALVLALLRDGQSPGLNQAARTAWVIALSGICLSFFVVLKNIINWRFNTKNPGTYWDLSKSWLAILPLSFAMALALFPAHIFNPFVLPILFERFVTLDGNSDILATAVVSAKLYLGLVLFKLGLPFGIATIFALLWIVRKSVKNKKILLITVTLAFFGLLLAILPLQQPFWLMSVYPLIVLALSAVIIQGLTTLKNRKICLAWAGYIAFAAAWLIVGIIQVYPTFGFYGYETVGEEWLGLKSRGFRAVVGITNDGSTEAIDWLRQNVSAESEVISYLNDVHIINYLQNTQPFPFKFTQNLQLQSENERYERLATADFVVIHTINNNSSFPLPTHPDFTSQFGSDPTHQIVRGRGVYQMPVIQIYQRISEAD